MSKSVLMEKDLSANIRLRVISRRDSPANSESSKRPGGVTVEAIKDVKCVCNLNKMSSLQPFEVCKKYWRFN